MGGTFHGATVVTLDAKGRLAIPTRHRDALLASAKYVVLTAHPEGCVLVYPPAAWEPVRAKAETFPSFHPQASWWKRLLLGFEEHVTPDGSGRILLSGALRQHAKKDPKEVARYVRQHADRLSGLSKREALKHRGEP